MSRPRPLPSGLATLLALAMLAAPAWGQGNRVVRGVTRDSTTGQAVAGALVELRSSAFRATDRSDEEGNFRIRGVPDGTYQLSVLRIGFAEVKWDLEVGSREAGLIVRMVPVAARLDAFRVRGDISAIYGMVGTLPDLLPLSGAKVQVLGADKVVVTDSTGGFFIPVRAAGTYMVRMTREGYEARMFPIAVPRDRAVDGSRMLDPGEAPHPGLEVVYKDMDQRLRVKASTNAALVPGAEIRYAGNNLIDGLTASPSFAAKGMRIVDSACVFVNGVPRPGTSLEMFRPEEIEAVEVYGQTAGSSPVKRMPATGDRSASLANQWPERAACGRVFNRSFANRPSRPTGGIQSGNVIFVVVWLRK